MYGLTINHKFDLFETRMAMQSEAVDVFILHESNYTNLGSVKELKFLQKFQQGWLVNTITNLSIYSNQHSQKNELSMEKSPTHICGRIYVYTI